MKEIDSYLNSIDKQQRAALNHIRDVAMDVVPDAEETFSYGMPVLKYRNKYLLGYAAFKNHLSMFPGSGAVESLKDELKQYKTSKGTIQFTLDQPVSDAVIRKIVEARIAEIVKSS